MNASVSSAEDEEAGSTATKRCATVDWSYSLLTGTEQLVFSRLGTFPNTFDAAAAEAVVTGGGIEGWDVLDALSSLVDVDAPSPTRRRRLGPGIRCSKPYVPPPASPRRDRRRRRSATTPRPALRHLR
jgi:hypothetical protein